MATQTYNLIYACTPAQLATVIAAIIAAPATVLQIPNINTGIIKLATNEQIDYTYDGAYYLRFFGANPVPVSQQTTAGIPQTELSTTMQTFLTTYVNPTCGAPVPSNQANVAGPAA